MRIENLLPWRRDRETIALRGEAEPYFALHDRINRLFDDFFRGTGLTGTMPAAGLPSIDVSDSDGEIRVDVELPGVEEKDIQLTLTDDTLEISGEKKSEEKKDAGSFQHVERSWGSFRRVVTLPCEVVADEATATFKKGVLSVRLPKAQTAKERTRKIEVRSGD